MQDSDGVAGEDLHDHTYGITSDPLTQFAVVLSALIVSEEERYGTFECCALSSLVFSICFSTTRITGVFRTLSWQKRRSDLLPSIATRVLLNKTLLMLRGKF